MTTFKPPLMKSYEVPEGCDEGLQTLAVAIQVMEQFHEDARYRALQYLLNRFCPNVPF